MDAEVVGKWAMGIAIVAVVGGLPIVMGVLPSVLGPEGFAERMPLRAPLRWEVERHTYARVGERDVLLVDARGVRRSGESPDTGVYRLILIDRATGEVLGRHTAFHNDEPLAFRGGRLWVESYDDQYEALTLPDLEPEADLGDLLDGRELAWDDVDKVAFPDDTENVRMLAKDGFLWDLAPDLVTLTRMHHDTPVASTPSLPSLGVAGTGGELTLPSGRVAILGTGSRRPALRVAEQRGALETTEIVTPHDGFLDGAFLAVSWNAPIVRAPEDVFVRHVAEDGGSFRLSRVSTREGLRWTKGEAEWIPGGPVEDAKTELVAVEDRGDQIVLWLERTPAGVWSGADHFLVGVDPDTGDALYLTAF